MAAFALLLAVLLATLNRGAPTTTLTGEYSTSALVCSPEGFAPTFKYDPKGENQEFKFEVHIGDGGTDCKYEGMAYNKSSSEKTVTTGDLKTGSTELPYKDGSGDVLCGGTFAHINDSNGDKIEYEVEGKIILYRKYRNNIVRKVQYLFKLECHLLRDKLVSEAAGYNISAVLQSTGAKDEKKEDYQFTATMSLMDETYTTKKDTKQTYNNNDDIYLAIEQGTDQDYFTYTVQSCYATSGSNASPTDSKHKDTFIDDMCPVDETTTGEYDVLKYKIKTMAFTFNTPKANALGVWFHCNLKVCLATETAGECDRAKSCDPTTLRLRKRRAISALDDDVKLVSASAPVFLKGSEFRAQVCEGRSVFDRVLGTCSSKNIMEIRGVRLSNDVFRPDYANTSSVAFREMAYTKEYQLWVLLKASNNHRVIEGVKIIRARPGSVVLDVLAKYNQNLLAEEAFGVFEKAMKTPASTTRVQNILKIKQGTTQVEFVPIVIGNGESEGMDSEKLILIVVLAGVFLVVFVAAGALFKARNSRQSNATGLENKGVDA